MSKKKESDGATATDAQVTTPFAKHLQSIADRETEQGFRGVEVDPTPNENYTVKGVTKGLPTPETDVEAAKDARGVTGTGLSALEAEAINRGKK